MDITHYILLTRAIWCSLGIFRRCVGGNIYSSWIIKWSIIRKFMPAKLILVWFCFYGWGFRSCKIGLQKQRATMKRWSKFGRRLWTSMERWSCWRTIAPSIIQVNCYVFLFFFIFILYIYIYILMAFRNSQSSSNKGYDVTLPLMNRNDIYRCNNNGEGVRPPGIYLQVSIFSYK